MPSDPAPEPTVVKGVYEPFEGIRDFRTLDEYVAKWVTVNTLNDLETVFEGAKERWSSAKHEPGAAGRGDFVLASGLLPLFDHFGALLAHPTLGRITPTENIARVCRRLGPELNSVRSVFANLARNALTHGAWPQTACIVDVPIPGAGEQTWAFGISFNANADPQRHDTFHNKAYTLPPNLPPPRRIPAKTLKLVLNVHNLRSLLVEAIENGTLFRGASPQTFDRVRLISELSGDFDENSQYELKRLTKLVDAVPKRMAAINRCQLCTASSAANEVERLFAEASRLGALDSPLDEKVKRHHRQREGAGKGKERR
jgi:hypothetical protein